MRIAVFSDIHGNKEALEAIISDIEKRNIDKVICLGDTVALGPSSKECLDLIIKKKIPMLLGNHELYHMYGHNIDKSFTEAKTRHHNWLNDVLSDSYKNFLFDCNYDYKLELAGKKITFQHFLYENKYKNPFYHVNILDSDKLYDVLDSLDDDIIVVGHEHERRIIKHNSKELIVVGSSGCLYDDNTFYTLLSDETGNIAVEKIDIKYDRDKFEEVFNDSNNPEKELYNKMFFGVKLKKM
ncbi:MAG: metallophosphoesterase family protein [Bacilli bacterium]|nr:metallophosphoesterase family protein [Bacilli bacterium]